MKGLQPLCRALITLGFPQSSMDATTQTLTWIIQLFWESVGRTLREALQMDYELQHSKKTWHTGDSFFVTYCKVKESSKYQCGSKLMYTFL